MTDRLRLRTEDGSLEAALESITNSQLRVTHTSIPGIIKSFDIETQLATIEIAVQQKLNGQNFKITQLKGVPVMFFRAGNYVITGPVQEGDEVEIHFQERSIENWLLDGNVVPPSRADFHDLNDAIAQLGLYCQPRKISDFSSDRLEIRTLNNNTKVSLGDTDIKIETSGAVVTVRENGSVTISNGTNDLVSLIAQLAQLTSVGQIGGSTFNNATAIAAVHTLMQEFVG